MIEPATQVKLNEPGALPPPGVTVGSTVIEEVRVIDDVYPCHLMDVERVERPVELRNPSAAGRVHAVFNCYGGDGDATEL